MNQPAAANAVDAPLLRGKEAANALFEVIKADFATNPHSASTHFKTLANYVFLLDKDKATQMEAWKAAITDIAAMSALAQHNEKKRLADKTLKTSANMKDTLRYMSL